MTIAYMRVPAEFLNSDYVDDKIVIIVGRRVSMKPTFVLLVIIHILEAVGIIWYSVSTSIYGSKYIAKVIQVPENMVLTKKESLNVLVFILIAVHLIVGLLFFLIFGTGNYLSK